MASYGTARNSLVAGLLKDAAAHEGGRYDEIGRRFDGVEHELPGGASPALKQLRVAMAFWDAWIDARDRGWLGGGTIDKGEWPMLARRIASELAQDGPISDARVRDRFGGGRSSGERVQMLTEPVRAL